MVTDRGSIRLLLHIINLDLALILETPFRASCLPCQSYVTLVSHPLGLLTSQCDMKARFHKRTWRTRKKVIIWTPLDEDKNDDDDVGTGWARPMIRPPLQAFDDYHDIDDM